MTMQSIISIFFRNLKVIQTSENIPTSSKNPTKIQHHVQKCRRVTLTLSAGHTSYLLIVEIIFMMTCCVYCW